jgi:hypothetical protein
MVNQILGRSKKLIVEKLNEGPKLVSISLVRSGCQEEEVPRMTPKGFRQPIVLGCGGLVAASSA